MLPHHATTRQQRHQHLVNDGVLPKEAQRDNARKEWKEKNTGKENLPKNNSGRCMYSENIHDKINRKKTCKLSQIQVNTHIHEHMHTHCFMYRISTALTNNKLHEIFSKISNMCSFPFCTCTSAKKNCWERAMGRRGGGGGGGRGVNEGKGRASSRRDRVSERETDCERERANTQLTLLQATPLSNSPSSACIPLAGSQSHVWHLSQLQASLQVCILDFIFTMATQPWP